MSRRLTAVGVALALPAMAGAQPADPIDPVDLLDTTTTATVARAAISTSTVVAMAALSATVTPSLIEGLLVDDSPLTTAVRSEPEPNLHLGRLLLDIPGQFIELAFLPLSPILQAAERYQLHQRIFDLITNEAHTFAAAPIVEVFSSSGIGFGGAVIYNDPLLSPDRFTAIGLGRMNGDISSTVVFGRRLPNLSGRTFSIQAGYDLDHDFRYYGFDPQNRGSRRLIRVEAINAQVAFQLLNPGDSDFRLYVEGAYRRRDQAPGVGDETPLRPGDGFAPPGGFGRTLDYPEATLRLELDTRDSGGRTTNGVIASVEGVYTADVQGAGTGGLQGTTQLSFFAPVLPLHRVVFMQFGAKFAAPLRGQLPLHHLVSLGGSHTLRGYDTDRFLGRFGWWGTFEYRYKVFEDFDSSLGFSTALFFDVGQAGQDFGRMLMSPLRWSAGIGLRFETALFLLGRLQLGYSPEGILFTAGIGELL